MKTSARWSIQNMKTSQSMSRLNSTAARLRWPPPSLRTSLRARLQGWKSLPPSSSLRSNEGSYSKNKEKSRRFLISKWWVLIQSMNFKKMWHLASSQCRAQLRWLRAQERRSNHRNLLFIRVARPCLKTRRTSFRWKSCQVLELPYQWECQLW